MCFDDPSTGKWSKEVNEAIIGLERGGRINTGLSTPDKLDLSFLIYMYIYCIGYVMFNTA